MIEHYGWLLVFVNILLEQLGAPLPAYPTPIITGPMASRCEYSVPFLLLTAVAAALIADYVWFRLGRRYGRRVLSLLCKISLSADSCVRQAETSYTRCGAPSLVIAKFIPGFASVASALACTIGTPTMAFLFFDTLGAAIWAGLGLYLGTLCSCGIDNLLNVLLQLPFGYHVALCRPASVSSMKCMIWRQRSKYSVPWAVRLRRRVVR